MNVLLFMTGILIIYRLLRYITTPIFRKTGLYKYYSPMFFTLKYMPNVYELHFGTSWDFLKLQNKNPKVLLKYLSEGLYNLCNDIESGKIGSNKILKGYIYYFKESTTERFGFHTRHLNFFEIIMFSLNYLELCLLKSIAAKKLSYIPFKNIRIHYCRAEELLIFKSKILDYYLLFNKMGNIYYENNLRLVEAA